MSPRARPTHPWLDGRFPEAEGLSSVTRIYSFLAGHVASGDLKAVAEDWSYLDEEAQPGGLEVILQTHLFAGYPRTINALTAVHAQRVAAGVVQTREPPREQWPGLGEGTCRRVYGEDYERLRRRIEALHPDFDLWMVETGYGRVLSRPGLTLRDRELCVLAVLAGQDVAPQLRSHLLGAARAGASPAQCRAVLEQTGAVWGAAAQVQAMAVFSALGAKLEAVWVAPPGSTR